MGFLFKQKPHLAERLSEPRGGFMRGFIRGFINSIAGSVLILLFSFSTFAIEPTKNPPPASGTPVAKNATMNDHDKMLEACNGMHGKADCDAMMKKCEAEKDSTKCMQMKMGKHK
jgi:hypothetical protein